MKFENRTFENGKKSVLEKVPVWRKCTERIKDSNAYLVKRPDKDDCLDGYMICLESVVDPKWAEYYIPTSELEKLPKEE